MNRVEKLVEIARALKPKHQQLRAFHVAGIFKKSRLIALAHNMRKSHPFALKNGYPFASEAIHAETLAIIRGNREDYEGHDLIILRIDNQNKINTSKPCCFCGQLINKVNFDNVFYSNEHGFFEKY
jgi:deoxycytidylate deaminase